MGARDGGRWANGSAGLGALGQWERGIGGAGPMGTRGGRGEERGARPGPATCARSRFRGDRGDPGAAVRGPVPPGRVPAVPRARACPYAIAAGSRCHQRLGAFLLR